MGSRHALPHQAFLPLEVITMMYTMHYNSPLGGILLAADETGLTGL